jgi:hypothetical protein
MNDEPNLPPNDEQLLRWIDRSLPEDQLKALDLSATPAWHDQRAAAQLIPPEVLSQSTCSAARRSVAIAGVLSV